MFVSEFITDDFEIRVRTKTEVLSIPIQRSIYGLIEESGLIVKKINCFKEPELAEVVGNE